LHRVNARTIVSNDSSDRWRAELTITLQGRSNARTIEGDSCGAVADAVALVLAFVIDPELAASRQGAPAGIDTNAGANAGANATPDTGAVSTPPALAAPNSLPPAAADVAAAEPPPRAPSRRRVWTVRLGTGVDAAALPQWTEFLSLSVRRAFGPASLEGTVAYLAPRTRSIDATRGGRFDLATVGARGFYTFPARGFELSPCLGMELGTVRGTAFGVAASGQGRGLWMAATAGGAARWRIAPWYGVALEGTIALPLVRPDYVIDNVGLVYRPDFIDYRGFAGIEVYF
jgi:hypothetical protein